MKAGLSSSLVMHAALIAFGLVSLSAPKAHDTGDVQALPVQMIPLEELTQLQQGDLKADKADAPAPRPTARPDRVADARNVGDNEIDLDDVPKPEAKPRVVDTAAAPPPPAPAPKPEPVEAKPEPAPAPKPVEAKPEPKPEPAPEPVAKAPAPEPAPTPEPTPDPVADAIATAEAAPAMEFPDQLPKPESRPTPPRPQVAKAEDKKQTEKPTETAQADDLDQILDKAKALVTKEAPAGGGAKRAERTAALGGERPSNASKLSASEMDALRQRLSGCWQIPAGIEDAELLKVSVRFRLDRSGELEARPEVVRGGAASGPGRTAAESAVRAVSKCAPFNLPADKYETWAEVVVNFDPSDMF